MDRRTFLGALLLAFWMRPRLTEGQTEVSEPVLTPSPLQLGQPAAIGRYLEAMRKFLAEEWHKKTPEERARDLIRVAVNPELRRAKVRLVQGFARQPKGPRVAEFNSEYWRIHIDPKLLIEELNDDQLRQLVEFVYHEACHAEQYGLIARWIAGQIKGKPTGQGVLTRFVIHGPAADLAALFPLPPGDARIPRVRAWFDNILTYKPLARRLARASEERDAAERDLHGAADGGVTAPADPDKAARKAKAEEIYNRAFTDYHDQPLEADAYRVSDLVRTMFLEGAR